MFIYASFLFPGNKIDADFDKIGELLSSLLDEIHISMYNKAKAGRDEKIVEVLEWKDFVPNLERQCLVLTPFCDIPEWEEKVKVGAFYFIFLSERLISSRFHGRNVLEKKL